MPAKTEETKHSNSPSLLPGIPTVAASIARVLGGYPLDTIAKNAQVQQGTSNYAAILRNLKKNIDQKQGLRKLAAFYPGFPIAVVYKGTQLTLFECLSPWKESVRKYITNPVAADLLSGGSMAVVQTTLLQPLNPFKLRVQVGVAGYTWAAFKTDIFSGLGATYGRNFVFLGTTAVVSTQLEELMLHYASPDKNGERHLSAYQKENIRIVAGASAVFPCMPLDVLKTRRQTWSASQAKPGLIKMAIKIGKEEGASALFKGSIPYFAAELFGIWSYLLVKRKVNDYLNEGQQSEQRSGVVRKP